MESATQIQILVELVCLTLHVKSITPSPPVISKWLYRFGILAIVGQPIKEKENSEFKPVLFYLKIDLVSHPNRS